MCVLLDSFGKSLFPLLSPNTHILRPDSGSEQNYMNGFKCNVTSATSTTPLSTAQIPRRCGVDPDQNKFDAVPGNCTFGAKQPFYWFQAEQNSVSSSPLRFSFACAYSLASLCCRCSKTHSTHPSTRTSTTSLTVLRTIFFKIHTWEIYLRLRQTRLPSLS